MEQTTASIFASSAIEGNVPKAELLRIYLSQLMPKMLIKMEIDDFIGTTKLQETASVNMPADVYELIFGTTSAVLISTEEDLDSIFCQQRSKEFACGSVVTITPPVVFKHLTKSDKIQASFDYTAQFSDTRRKNTITEAIITPLPFAGPIGSRLLREAEEAGSSRWTGKMQKYFKRQRGDSYCGVASIMSVIPYLIEAEPKSKEYDEERIFSMLPGEDVAKLKEQIERDGLSLAELDALVCRLKLPHPVSSITTERYHASAMTVDSFRALIIDGLGTPNTGLVLNFDGALLPNNYKVDVGHHSPIVAYHSERDLVLLADVWPTCPIAWHYVKELWKATNSIDSDSNQHRGLLKIVIDK